MRRNWFIQVIEKIYYFYDETIEPPLAKVLGGVVLITALVLISVWNFLLFHTLVELFTIVVALSVFILVWNAYDTLKDGYLSFIGVGFLFIGILDILHTLTYKGMGIFMGINANMPTQFWIAARGFQMVMFLLGFAFLKQKPPRKKMMIGFSLAFLALFLSIFVFKNFPICYIDGQGLTPFKRIAEYGISTGMAVVVFLLVKQRERFEPTTYKFLIFAAVMMILSELWFTIYVGVSDVFNMIGHIFRLLSYYGVYQAILQVGFRRPVELFSVELDRREKDLQASQELIHSLIDLPTDEMILADAQGTILMVNRTFANGLGRNKKDYDGKNLFKTLAEEISLALQPGFYKVLWSGRRERLEVWYRKVFYDIVIHPIKDEAGTVVRVVILAHDITLRKGFEDRLRESETRLRSLIEAVPDLMCRFDAAGICQEVLHMDHTLTIESEPTLEVGLPQVMVSGEIHNRRVLMINEALGSGDTQKFDYELPANQQLLHKEERLVPIGQGQVLSIIRDMTGVKKVEALVAESERRFRTLYEATPISYFSLDEAGRILEVNQEWQHVMGYQRAEVIGRPLVEFLMPVSREAFNTQYSNLVGSSVINGLELDMVSKDGTLMVVLLDARVGYNFQGQYNQTHCVFRDITERKRTEERLTFMASHDSLTGLINRVAYTDTLGYAIQEARFNEKKLAIFFVDLDNFKQVNDKYGHDYGDQLLKAIAIRLCEHLRDGDVIGRLSGDEFAVIAKNLPDESAIALVAEKITDVFRDDFLVNQQTLSVRASVGASRFPEDGQDARTLLIKADQAMYLVKHAGKNHFHLYQDNDRTALPSIDSHLNL